MENSLLVHKHLIVRAEINNPPIDENYLKSWLNNFIMDINMKVFMGPYVKYCTMPGNRGITAVAIIETSHIAFHSWDEDKPAVVQLDVYTCSHLNKQTVFDALEKFEPIEINYLTLDREKYLNIIHI